MERLCKDWPNTGMCATTCCARFDSCGASLSLPAAAGFEALQLAVSSNSATHGWGWPAWALCRWVGPRQEGAALRGTT